MPTLKQIGWWYWSILNPESRLFTTVELTAEDKQNGYVCQPVYIDVKETP